MADIDVSFGAVTLPTGTSATLTVYEDTSGDGDADTSKSTALSDNTTSYTLSGFDGGSGNDYWWDLEPDHSDLTADNVVSAPVDLTIPDSTTVVEGSSSILGDGKVVADASKVLKASASIAGSGEVDATPLVRVLGSASVFGDGDVSATPLTGIFGDVSITGDGSVETTADVVVRNWLIDGVPFEDVDGVELDAKTLTLSGVAARYRLRQLRQFKRAAEKVDVVVDDDGRFSAVDRSLDGNVYTITPPVAEDPPQTMRDMLVADFSETRAAKQEEKSEVEIVLQKPESRDPSGDEPSETASTGEWLFEFYSGAVATRRVRVEQESVIETAKDVERLSLVLTAEQVLVLATSAAYPDAVSIVEIPDGQNLAQDNSTDDRQTVEVTAPSAKEQALASGTYVVDGWSASRIDSDSYEVSLDLRPKA